MRKLTHIILTAAIFAAALINITTQVILTIREVLRPVYDTLREYLGKKDPVQKLQAALDIYIKHKKINEKIPEKEASVVDALLKICRQDKTMFDTLRQENKCTLEGLRKNLLSIIRKIPIIG